MRELFVYYRASVSDAPALIAAVGEFQACLRADHPHLATRLLCRAEARDGQNTWMESYAIDPIHEPAGITPEIQALIEAQARVLEPLINGPRHAEVFVTCAS
ncbi:MAG: DUF4936 family protein [Burkholderiaceae bacterium]